MNFNILQVPLAQQIQGLCVVGLTYPHANRCSVVIGVPIALNRRGLQKSYDGATM